MEEPYRPDYEGDWLLSGDPSWTNISDILEFLEDHDEDEEVVEETAGAEDIPENVALYEKLFNKEIDNGLVCLLVGSIWKRPPRPRKAELRTTRNIDFIFST